MTVKTQLKAYYAKQGLTGQHARQAIRHDMRSIRKQANEWNSMDSLFNALYWRGSKEGSRYWLNRFVGNGE